MARVDPGPVTPVRVARPADTDRWDDLTRRVIRRRAGLPGTRAVVGALLITLAAIGVFVAYTDAAGAPSDRVVIARHALRIGEVIGAGDLRVVPAELPADATGSFAEVDGLIGRVALGPIGEGEIIQAGSLTDDRNSSPTHEVALLLPREQVAVGHLKQGDRVDVFVTREDRTTSIARGAQVVQIGTESDGSLAGAREVTIVVAAPSGEAAAALVHALRTGDVTVVRSTFASFEDGEPIAVDTAGEAGSARG